MAGASKDVLAGGVQDLVPTIGWERGSMHYQSTLPVMVTVEIKGGEVGMSSLE